MLDSDISDIAGFQNIMEMKKLWYCIIYCLWRIIMMNY